MACVCVTILAMTERLTRFVAGWNGNTLEDLARALLVFAAVMLCVTLFRLIMLRRLETLTERTGLKFPLIVLRFLESVRGWTWAFLSFVLAVRLLDVPPLAHRVLTGAALVVGVWLCVRFLQQVLSYLLVRHVPRLRSADGESLPAFLRLVLGMVLWSWGILLVLSNIGIDVTSLIAGLGIGGIAIALATQNILGDIFSSFSLYFDEPFKEGDYVVVGQHSGTVKRIGLKTTRLQALSGEELVISNQELTSSRIENFKKMRERHASFRFTLAQDTPVEKLRRVPEIVKECIQGKHETIEFDRSNIREFTEAGVVVDALYTLKTDVFSVYVNAHQSILLDLAERFAKEGIRWAVPVRRLEQA
jgi:small-conductance mechanosensitive channel